MGLKHNLNNRISANCQAFCVVINSSIVYMTSHFSQVFINATFIVGFKELPANGALLLYISADGCFTPTKHPEDSKLTLPRQKCSVSIFSKINLSTIIYFKTTE